jgi:hypothetical protein
VVAVDDNSDADAKLPGFGDGTVHRIHAARYAHALVTVEHNRGRLIPQDDAVRQRVNLATGQSVEAQGNLTQAVGCHATHFLEDVHFGTESSVRRRQPRSYEEVFDKGGEDASRDIHSDSILLVRRKTLRKTMSGRSRKLAGQTSVYDKQCLGYL